MIKDGCGDYWDGVVLAVGMKQDVVPNLEISDMEWEDVCGRFGPRGGFEWVDFEGVGRNEFNEPKGVARIKEALEATDWDGMGDDNLDLDGLDEFDGDDGFDAEAIELEMEMFGMKQAIYGAGDGGGESKDGDNAQNTGGNKKTGSDEEDGVEQLESMMLRLQAVKGKSQYHGVISEDADLFIRHGSRTTRTREKKVCSKGRCRYHEDIMITIFYSFAVNTMHLAFFSTSQTATWPQQQLLSMVYRR